MHTYIHVNIDTCIYKHTLSKSRKYAKFSVLTEKLTSNEILSVFSVFYTFSEGILIFTLLSFLDMSIWFLLFSFTDIYIYIDYFFKEFIT